MLRHPGSRLAVLKNRNFRIFVSGQILSAIGTWMMVATQDWLVLDWSTNSPSALAIVTLCQFSPSLIAPLIAGSIADRIPKRNLLVAVNCGLALLTAAQSATVLLGYAELWHIYLFALFVGTFSAIEAPTRMAFVGEVVSNESFRDASSLSALYFSVAQMVGPAIAGALIASTTPGITFAINSCSYLATVCGLLMMRSREIKRTTVRGGTVDISRGIRLIQSERNLFASVILLACIGFFALHIRTTAPLFAKTIFEVSSTEFGAVATLLAVGSLFAAMFIGGRETPTLKAAATFSSILGIAILAFACSVNLLMMFAILPLCGASMTSFLQSTNHHLQLNCDRRDRTHVIAIYTMIVQGASPIAVLGIAAVAEAIGVRAVILIAGILTISATMWILHWNYRLGERKFNSRLPREDAI